MKSNNLECTGLVLAREGEVLLGPISHVFAAGSHTSLRGPNGCGKSTLLKCLAGLFAPQAGSLQWGGQHLRRHPDYPLCVTYLGHARGVDASFSVREQLTQWARDYQRSELVEAALRYFDLNFWQHIAMARLSAGWQQRVALARLMVLPGELWLLDEPSINLDAQGIDLLRSLIAARVAQGGVVVTADHQCWTNEAITLDIQSFQMPSSDYSEAA